MPESNAAKAAHCEDWDSDESSAVPGTLVQAQQGGRRSHHHQQPLSSSANRAPGRPDVASDSGYPSLAARSPTSVPVAAPAQSVAPHQTYQSPTKPKSKPFIHPADSARGSQNSDSTTIPSDKQTRRCSDPYCRDPNCSSVQTSEQHYTQYQHSPQRVQQNSAPRYEQMPQYRYAQVSPAQPSSMMPPPPMPRPRALSGSRQARPVSIHGYSSLSYNNISSGPPPSASAYYAFPQPYAQSQQPYVDTRAYTHQAHTYMDPLATAAYTAISPVPPSPTSPSVTYPNYPGYTGTYSARQPNPAIPGLDMPKAVPQPGLSRTLSARQGPLERPRKLYSEPESSGSEMDSLSESDSEASSDDEHHRRKGDPRRQSYRREDTAALSHQSRRPSMSKKYYTETTVPTRTRRGSLPREVLRRAPRSDTLVDYPSSSDVGDSDRTARTVIDRRSTFSSARSSRRPSVSTTASSGRTKATTLSSMTDGSRGQLIIEGKSGRRVAYLSKEDQAKLVRRYQQQQLEDKLDAQRVREEKIAAYQNNMTGGQPFELTAENMRRANNRKSGSHVSGRSHKSSGSGSKTSRSEGIQIQSGDTILHIYGDAKVEMRPSEDGGPAQFLIARNTSRESEYRTSSKGSSNSRVGRSRNRSDVTRRVIREDPVDYHDGYDDTRR